MGYGVTWAVTKPRSSAATFVTPIQGSEQPKTNQNVEAKEMTDSVCLRKEENRRLSETQMENLPKRVWNFAFLPKNEIYLSIKSHLSAVALSKVLKVLLASKSQTNKMAQIEASVINLVNMYHS